MTLQSGLLFKRNYDSGHYAMVGDREKALAAGCDGYLEKPINPDTFVSQVENYLRPRATED